MTIRDFLCQPSTVAGLAALCGTLDAVFSGQMSWPAALPFLVGAAVSILLPDNSAAKRDTEALVRAAEALAGAARSQNSPTPTVENT